MFVGVGVLWIGYTLAYFGWRSLKCAGVGLVDLVVPGRLTEIPPCPGGSSSAPANTDAPGWNPNSNGGQFGGGGASGSWASTGVPATPSGSETTAGLGAEPGQVHA